MFTQVNFRCINKIGDWLNERGSETITFVCDKTPPIVDQVNALKRKSLL
jgi:hypothetical protein